MFTLRIQKGGYGAEYFLPDEVEVTYDHTTMYDFPIADRKRAHAFIVKQQQKNANMWNGPCVRLDKYEVRVPNEVGNARERGKLKLALSGLGWFGYVGMNQELGDQLRNKTRKLDEELIETIGFPHWFNSQELSTCRFSNIVGTATTLVSSDGYVGYLVRGADEVAPGRCTSSIAENVNRLLDDASANDCSCLENPGVQLTRGTESEQYNPKRIPHPFAAVRRGINVEGSPKFGQYFPSTEGIKLLGIAFDLISMHPDLLFAAFLPISHADALRMRITYPGRE